MPKKIPPIRYTSRDFDSIRTDLVNYAKKYYPQTHQDFNEGSFGTLMIDTVAYVGDILSYYLDYQTNESFLDTAIEYENILKLGAGLGYKQKTAVSAVGVVTLYVSIPANAEGTDCNFDYLPTIKRGTTFRSTDGNSFTLSEDVVITEETAEIRKSKLNDKAPYEYVAKVYGRVISGVEQTTNIKIGDFEKFKKVLVGTQNVSEILSVTDSDGNRYYEVDYLTQNVVYTQANSNDPNTSQAILKPVSVVRRYVTVREGNNTYIQFGGSANSDTTYNNLKKIDPTGVVLDKFGKDYITDESFDPTVLVSSNDKLGLGPSNTTLTIVFRVNPNLVNSIPARAITSVIKPRLSFPLNAAYDNVKASIANSMVVTNEYPLNGGSDDFTSDEMKRKIYGSFGAQNRAVTEEDYKSLCYNMPGKFGSIKRVRILKDTDESKRNLNLYVISSDSRGYLVTTNATTKNNLKNWLNKSKIINDTIDILDAKIVNFGIYFTAAADKNYNKYDVLAQALNALKREFSIKMDIGEHIQFSRIYDALRKVPGLLDVRNVEILQRLKSDDISYSDYSYNFKENITQDGMFLKVPKNVIMEIKFSDLDIQGKII